MADQAPTSNKPLHISADAFDKVLASAGDKPVLVDFFAQWCGPCKMIAPVIEEIAGDFEGKAVIGKVDVDSEQALAQRFGVMSIPTLLLFKNGQQIDKKVGFNPKSVLADWINQQLA